MVLQKNVPIDEPIHSRLKRIAILDGTTMKGKVTEWIVKDGRGVVTGEVPELKPVVTEHKV
jgi:hypothetical protein